jgi:hypothetical protein
VDQEILVKAGHTIVKALDNEGAAPRAALWVHATDTDTWKFWILPHTGMEDKRDFYRRLAMIVSKNRDSLGGIDAADVELITDEHPVIKSLRESRAFRITGLSGVLVQSSTFNGYYLAEALILRMIL